MAILKENENIKKMKWRELLAERIKRFLDSNAIRNREVLLEINNHKWDDRLLYVSYTTFTVIVFLFLHQSKNMSKTFINSMLHCLQFLKILFFDIVK